MSQRALFFAAPLALALAVTFAGLSLVSCGPAERSIHGAPVYTDEFVSKAFEVRALYPSMLGPSRTRPLAISAEPNELIWITGARMEVVDMDGDRLETQDNLCHASIRSQHSSAKWMKHNTDLFGGMRHLPAKWFTLVAGQLDLTLPEGFGIPLYANEPLEAFTMILNQDPDFEPFELRVKTQLDYVYDRDVDQPMRALSRTGFDTKVAVANPGGAEHDHGSGDHSSHAHSSHDPDSNAESCGLNDDDFALTSVEPAGPKPIFYPGPGNTLRTMHFMVPPGRHEFRDRHKLRGLPAGLPSVQAHYITAHMHVYGESVELIDVTEGKSVFKSEATSNEERTAVIDVASWSSSEGVALYADHEYEIVTTYDNTTDSDIDAMGVVYIYFENPHFKQELLAEQQAARSRSGS